MSNRLRRPGRLGRMSNRLRARRGGRLRQMPKLLALFELLAAGLTPYRVAAYDFLGSAEGLLDACNEFERTLQPMEGNALSVSGAGASVCWGFMGAMQEVGVFADPVTKQPLLRACLPPESGLVQLIRVFTAFARSHPELLHRKPAEVVSLAFQSAFPCR